MLNCPRCGSGIPDTEEKCPTCGFIAGPPNVRAAERPEERDALEARYQQALELAKTNGYLDVLEKLDEAAKETCAVINIDLDFVYFFTRSSKNLYTNYERGVESRIRKPAELLNDQRRRATGAIVFGGYAREIIYAALSLDGSGPQSYGPYAIRLRDIAIQERATVLENNSYDFIQKHGLGPGDGRPPGFLAPWKDRHKLVVAKLGARLVGNITEADFPQLLLSSQGNRATDEFHEVHIYGSFDINAIESVKGNSKEGSRDERDILRMVKQHLTSAGKVWIEP